MTTQSLGSSIAHSSDSRYTSAAPEASIENESVLGGGGAFRAYVWRSVMSISFQVPVRSSILFGDLVCFLSCPGTRLDPAAELDTCSRCFSSRRTAV
jgi:hypothetical protein